MEEEQAGQEEEVKEEDEEEKEERRRREGQSTCSRSSGDLQAGKVETELREWLQKLRRS